jgi:hypothetical protein
MSNNNDHKDSANTNREKINALKLGTKAILEAHGHKFEPTGTNYKTSCRFHPDKTPSMMLYRGVRLYCFGCGWKGDFIQYLLDAGLAGNFAEALKVGEQAVGGDLAKFKMEASQLSSSTTGIAHVSEDFLGATVIDAYINFLDAVRRKAPILTLYADELGFGDLGAANERLGKFTGCFGLHKNQLGYLYSDGMKVRPLAGQSESKFYTVGKIHHAWRANLIGDGTRTVYLVEGESDAIAAVLSGMEDDGTSIVTAAPGCKSFRPEWAEDYTGKDVVICMDFDDAGQASVESIAKLVSHHANSVSVVRGKWKEGGPKDLRGLYMTGSAQMVVDLLKSAVPWFADVQSSDSVPSGRPQLLIPGDNRPLGDFCGELGKFLHGKNFYQRGGLPFASIPSPDGYGSELKIVTPQMFRSMVDADVETVRYRKTPDGPELVRRSLDLDTAQAVLQSPQFLGALPVLDYTRPAPMPIIRQGGKLDLLPLGYDPESRTLTHDDVRYDRHMELDAAKRFLDEMLCEFNFAESRSKAASIAAMLTCMSGHLMPQDSFIPCFLFDANSQGSGKTTLAQLVALPYGTVAVQPAPKHEPEWRKRLLAMIIAGRGITILDNIDHHIDSSALSMYLTSYSYSDRILGVSQEFTGKPSTIILATGNKMTYSRDLARRVIVIDLHSEELRAEERQYKMRINLKLLQKYRPLLMAALWALVKEWDRAGRPKCSTTNASFPDWCEVVGGIVEHNGFGDPVIRGQRDDAGDIDTIDLENLAKVMGVDLAYAFKDIVTMCGKHGLFERFVDDTDELGQLSRQAKSGFGKTLKSFDKRLVKGMGHFRVTGKGHYRRYAVVSPDEPREDESPSQS